MKVLICLTIFLFTSVQFRTEEIAIYDREKFICVDSLEKVEDEKPIAWVGFRDRDFISPIFGKQRLYILGLLLNGGFLRFIDWSILPRKPPNASFYVKKGLALMQALLF
jgi:hypothetical protein